MVRLRLQRFGDKRSPYYRIVAADQRKARNGRYIEQLGTYDPKVEPPVIRMDGERVHYWIDNGAQPSDTVQSFVDRLEEEASNVVDLSEEGEDEAKREARRQERREEIEQRRRELAESISERTDEEKDADEEAEAESADEETEETEQADGSEASDAEADEEEADTDEAEEKEGASDGDAEAAEVEDEDDEENQED
jgi:small subunit ribosomal protein S16